VVQHYEIWPTPLLDLTSSLRVAASFALGLEDPRKVGKKRKTKPGKRSGHLYVLAVPDLLSDFQELDERSPRMQVLRLNAVCPPDAVRPHFQDGFLMTWPQPGGALDLQANAESKLVAKFRLIDTGHFWSKDFPRHTFASLLPEADHDALLRRFRKRITYRREGNRLAIRP
jgi:hypothetical protein